MHLDMRIRTKRWKQCSDAVFKANKSPVGTYRINPMKLRTVILANIGTFVVQFAQAFKKIEN